MRKNFLILLFMIIIIAVPQTVAAKAIPQKVSGNLVKFTTGEDFSKGSLNNLTVKSGAGNGGLVLSGGSKGVFTSGTLSVKPFQQMIASWNADTPAGTRVEIFARCYVDSNKKWSGWRSWGKWSQSIGRACADGGDSLVQMDTDTFQIKGGKTGSRIQLKAELYSTKSGATPVLKQLTASFKNTLSGKKITPTYTKVKLPKKVQLDTPAYSQIIREPSIANSMCSAVTVCTLLNDRGEDKLPEEIALNCYDTKYKGFGNWSFSMAAAGAYGYDAYVQYGDLTMLKHELAKGYSVGISVSYSSSSGGKYPYLKNGAAQSTGGHLITITGYKTVKGVDYFYSSDSAAKSDKESVRCYRADQLDKAWSNKMAYIVHKKENGAGLPGWKSAELKRIKSNSDIYKLYVNGKVVKLEKSFTGNKLKESGAGIVAYYKDGSKKAQMPSPVQATTANYPFGYAISVTSNGNLNIKPKSVLGNSSAANLQVFVMKNNGVTYKAKVKITK